MDLPFWDKPLDQLTTEQWELLCDGCGLCCLRKFITGYGKREKIHFTSIACNLLDLSSGACQNYTKRFELEDDCTKLRLKDLYKFSQWLPLSCAYRLRFENKPLPNWHPLISGDKHSAWKFARKNIFKLNSKDNAKIIHEKKVDSWQDYLISNIEIK